MLVYAKLNDGARKETVSATSRQQQIAASKTRALNAMFSNAFYARFEDMNSCPKRDDLDCQYARVSAKLWQDLADVATTQSVEYKPTQYDVLLFKEKNEHIGETKIDLAAFFELNWINLKKLIKGLWKKHDTAHK